MTRRRGTTLVEILMATIVASLVAATVASLMSLLGGALREQDVLAAQLVRTAGGHARFSDHILRARALLSMSPNQLAVWVPSEDFIASNEFREAYDEINAKEIRWYSWIAAQHQLVMSRTLDEADNTVYPLTTNWEALYSSLQTGNLLKTVPVFDGLSSASFHSSGFNGCVTRRVNLELLFDANHGGQGLRVSEVIPFLQKHKDCQ